METFQQVNERIAEKLKNKLANIPRLSPEEYEAAKQRQYTKDYKGICRADCPLCGGIGFVKVSQTDDVQDPEFGKTKYCPNVDIVKLYGAGLGLEEYEIHTLDWAKVRNLGNGIEGMKAVQAVLRRGYGWITLWGNYGLAKSLILRIAVAESLRSGHLAAFVEMSGLLDDLRLAFDSNNSNEDSAKRLAKWQDIPILAIDEVDRINKTAWAQEREFAIFNHRYQMAIRQKTITLYASNQSPQKLGGALGDRMLDGRFTVIHLEGSSNRQLITGQDY